MSKPSSTRRRFLKTTAATTLGTSLLPAVSWGKVLGANDRLNLAVVGTGGMGSNHLRSLVKRKDTENIDVIQVCDVYRRRLNGAMAAIDQGEDAGTLEYREVIDNPDVDAIVIATPDHWHTKIAIEAMENGKDVYVEKPLSHTIPQALACRDAVKRTGRTLQVGPQGTSQGKYWAARQAIADGRIGKPVWSQGAYCRNSRGGQFNWPMQADAGPTNDPAADGYVWWDRWLGHDYDLAPKIEWNPDHFFRFRKYFAYNGGLATDLLYHRLSPLLMAISGHSGEYPKRVVASGGIYLEKDERDIPDTFFMMVDYPSEHTVALSSVMTNDDTWPDVIRGQYATMSFGNGITLDEQRVWSDEFRKANGIQTTQVAGDDGKTRDEPARGQANLRLDAPSRRDHLGNFMDAVRDGDRLACDVDLGCSVMVAIKMGVEAYRQNKVMTWDAESEVMVAV